jgi:Ca2+-dependent lipid-binding protein
MKVWTVSNSYVVLKASINSIIDQGLLTVDLVSASNLMAADKIGTSDPYVVFTVNGERVHKSDTIKKTLNPKWHNERFTVPIASISYVEAGYVSH